MENATKALLIAAAVLISIVLIALGVKLLNSSGNSSKQAEETGSLVSESTQIASFQTFVDLGASNEEIEDYIKKNFTGRRLTGRIIKKINKIVRSKYPIPGDHSSACDDKGPTGHLHFTCTTNYPDNEIQTKLEDDKIYKLSLWNHSIKVLDV